LIEEKRQLANSELIHDDWEPPETTLVDEMAYEKPEGPPRRDRCTDYKSDGKRLQQKWSDPELNRKKRLAYRAVEKALRDGVISRDPCMQCGRMPVQGHHFAGYEPEHHLDIIWLCFDCHDKISKKKQMELTRERVRGYR
jgi:hypothetical protein